MNNELKIKPLLEYEVTTFDGIDKFTADTMEHENRVLTFFRTGNIIRWYPNDRVTRVVVTPANEIQE